MPLVNGHPAECGCYVEGHWGQYGPDQYGPDHLADQAEGFGWEPGHVTDDPRYWRVAADAAEESGNHLTASIPWDRHSETADAIEAWLNDHTPSLCRKCAQPLTAGAPYSEWQHPGGVTLCADGGFADAQHFTWHWHDGEFFLSPICDNEEECNDDTCAHWS